MKDSSERITFNVKTWIGIMTVAWSPAIIIGGSLLKWSMTMDRRVTIQEEATVNITRNLEILNTRIVKDIETLKEKVDDHTERIVTLEVKAKE